MAHLREYDDIQYWDKRYLDEGDDTFDWYQRFKELKPLLCRYIKKDSRILMAGCGNAVLSEEMVLNGFKEIVNIDFSSVVIKKMQQRHRHIPQLTYVTMDVRNMAVFGDNSFDAVIDKGLMDSMLCGSNGFIDVSFMLEETRRLLRVLKPGGVFILITYGEPLLRMHHLKHPALDWKVVLHLTRKIVFSSFFLSRFRVSFVPAYSQTGYHSVHPGSIRRCDTNEWQLGV
ncbi:hypothetical protein SELMODRAFT_97591 [Selaginella moellendorffii]|uniref:Methyltransferase domain-containing protein n=1 Tax=Selaginella moellendorffii TaxID=88036 RepID=D8RMH9_SELML|nr:hypothetical protein SELMODRAFT_97591 [Selaginella moellendorffii]